MLREKADYRKIQKDIDLIESNRDRENSKIENELFIQKENIERAKKKKEVALESGTKEEYLEACSMLAKEEASLEFLEVKAKQLKEKNKVTIEELRVFKRDIRNEQNKVTYTGLIQLREAIENVCALCNEVIEEQNKGSELYSRLLSLFYLDASPGELKALSSNLDLNSSQYSMRYGMNFIVGISREAGTLWKVADVSGIREFIEGKD